MVFNFQEPRNRCYGHGRLEEHDFVPPSSYRRSVSRARHPAAADPAHRPPAEARQASLVPRLAAPPLYQRHPRVTPPPMTRDRVHTRAVPAPRPRAAVQLMQAHGHASDTPRTPRPCPKPYIVLTWPPRSDHSDECQWTCSRVVVDLRIHPLFTMIDLKTIFDPNVFVSRGRLVYRIIMITFNV